MTAGVVPDRNRWAVAQLVLRPEGRVLGFGCGPEAAHGFPGTDVLTGEGSTGVLAHRSTEESP